MSLAGRWKLHADIRSEDRALEKPGGGTGCEAAQGPRRHVPYCHSGRGALPAPKAVSPIWSATARTRASYDEVGLHEEYRGAKPTLGYYSGSNLWTNDMGMTGRELAAFRRRAGLSQAALARRIGVSRQTVSYWERKLALDGREPTLQRFATVLDPRDRKLLLSSRPGLGFITLKFVSPIAPEQLSLIFSADAQRKTTQAQMRRRTCGAMTRKAMKCRLKSEPGKQRCRLHGGLSTGPTSSEGKARVAEAQRKRWAAWREARSRSE